MIVIVGLIIGFLIGFIYMCFYWDGYDPECWASGFAGGVFGVLIGILLLISGNGALSINLTESEVVETKPIYAISDTMGVEGSFFLGSGCVDSDMKYVYAENTNKGIKLKTIDTDKAYVKYVDKKTDPYIEKIKLSHKEGFGTWLFGNPYKYEYIFYVPEGTVKNVYNIDFE